MGFPDLLSTRLSHVDPLKPLLLPSLNTAFVHLKSNQEVAFLCLPSSWTFSALRSSQSTQQMCNGSDHWAPLSAIPQMAHLAVMSSNLITLDLGSLRIKSLRKEMAGVWNFLDSQAEKVCVPTCPSFLHSKGPIAIPMLFLYRANPSATPSHVFSIEGCSAPPLPPVPSLFPCMCAEIGTYV